MTYCSTRNKSFDFFSLDLWRHKIEVADWLTIMRSKGGTDFPTSSAAAIREITNASRKQLCEIINLKNLKTFLQGNCPNASPNLKIIKLKLSFSSTILPPEKPNVCFIYCWYSNCNSCIQQEKALTRKGSQTDGFTAN